MGHRDPRGSGAPDEGGQGPLLRARHHRAPQPRRPQRPAQDLPEDPQGLPGVGVDHHRRYADGAGRPRTHGHDRERVGRGGEEPQGRRPRHHALHREDRNDARARPSDPGIVGQALRPRLLPGTNDRGPGARGASLAAADRRRRDARHQCPRRPALPVPDADRGTSLICRSRRDGEAGRQLPARRPLRLFERGRPGLRCRRHLGGRGDPGGETRIPAHQPADARPRRRSLPGEGQLHPGRERRALRHQAGDDAGRPHDQ